MKDDDEVVVPLGKLKLILVVLGSLIFVVLGVWLVSVDPNQLESSRRFASPRIIGYLCIAFFGVCGLLGIRKLFDTKPGLVFSSKGIIDNSSVVAAGLIPWSEITGFSEYQVKSTKMLIIHVKEPEKYANRGNKLKRALNSANMKLVGSPLSISSTSLGISYSELQKLAESSFKKYAKNI